MHVGELSKLRTKLRQVNVEFSALVRDERREGRFIRMGELKTERRALMALISARSEAVQLPPIFCRQTLNAANHGAACELPEAQSLSVR